MDGRPHATKKIHGSVWERCEVIVDLEATPKNGDLILVVKNIDFSAEVDPADPDSGMAS